MESCSRDMFISGVIFLWNILTQQLFSQEHLNSGDIFVWNILTPESLSYE